MRWKLGAMTAAAAIVTATLGATGVLAGAADDGPGQGAGPVEVRSLEAERVGAPSGAAVPAGARPAADRAQARAKPKKPELVYLETAPQTLSAGKTGFVIGDCPRKAKALNGYYFIRDQFNGFGLENEGDSPAGRRRWAFYLDAEGLPAGVTGVTFGLVCLKNVK